MLHAIQIAVLVTAACTAICRPASAEIKDYEILRFLYLKTSCGKSSIVRVELIHGALHFHADCQDKTAFPDGAWVMCSDPQDDRSCVLTNSATEFRNLQLLQPR